MPTKSWGEFPTVDADAAGPAEFPESGWGALLCWIAGPENVERIPRPHGDGGVTRVEVVTGGASARSERATTADERDLIDNSIDEYLADAGVPPRPRGYRWYARPGAPDPATWSRALQNAVDADGGPSDPHRVCELGEGVVQELGLR